MGQIKIGIVGLGNMGMTYAKALLAGLIPAARLTAICVNGTAKAVKARGNLIKVFNVLVTIMIFCCQISLRQ